MESLILVPGHLLPNMISRLTLLVSVLFLAIPLEANTYPKKCGNLDLTLPFEFGTPGEGSGSSIGDYWFDIIHSSTSYRTPTSYETSVEVQVQVSSFTKVRVNNSIVYAYSNYSCYTEAGAKMLHASNLHAAAINLTDGAQIIRTSNTITANKFTLIGYESFDFVGYDPLISSINCTMINQERRACSGINRGHSFIQRGIKSFFLKEAGSVGNITLLAMYFWFIMRLSGSGTPFKSSLTLPVSTVENISYASRTTRPPGSSRLKLSAQHSLWHSNSKKGFLVSKVREVDTHKNLENHMKKDRGYIAHFKVFWENFTLGLGFCCLFLVFGITGIYSSVKKQKSAKLKSEFFQKNGGLLLEQRISASTGGCTIIFTSKEIEMAIDYHTKSHIFGPGEGGVDRFIDEIITLTQINHQNMVKFLGCCLETEAPILVYELASNGTLFDYIHHTNGKRSLSWDTLLKIASESAAGLNYLHSASIIHGNVKSSNVLLTDRFVAKVAGFGPPRLFPTNESQISTLLQRTLGYLDPEYLHKGQLTDKSDVYSFGMVLLEIVTGEKPISFGRPESQRIISSHFISSMELQSGLFHEIVWPQIVREGDREQVREVAELAKRCLKLSSAERPTMEEVAGELKRLSDSHQVQVGRHDIKGSLEMNQPE
ncbi:wall-associated receptor kinase-like 8 [Rosa sericea]